MDFFAIGYDYVISQLEGRKYLVALLKRIRDETIPERGTYYFTKPADVVRTNLAWTAKTGVHLILVCRQLR